MITNVDDLAKELNAKSQIDLPLLNFSKAFDKSSTPKTPSHHSAVWCEWFNPPECILMCNSHAISYIKHGINY